MNQLLKEDNRLPDFWTLEIFFHKGMSKRFEVVSQSFDETTFQIKTTKNKFHIFRHDAYSEIAFDENYTTMLELKKEREIKNADPKAT